MAARLHRSTLLPRGGRSPRARIAALETALASARLRAHAHARAAATAQRAHAERTALLDTIFEVVPVGIVLFDTELRFVRINQALAAIDGRSAATYQGRATVDMQAQFARLLEPLLRNVLVNGEPIRDLPLHGATSTAPASARDWQASFYPVRGPDGSLTGVAVVVSENTGRHQAEQTIRERDEQLRLAHATAELGTWRYSTATGLVYLDARARTHCAIEVGAAPLDSLLARIHPEDRAMLSEGMPSLDDPASDGRFTAELRIIAPDQKIRWLAVQARLYYDEGAPDGPQFIQAVGVTRDISARKQVEAEQERYRRELAAIVENFHEGVVAFHPDGAIAVLNAATRRFHGLAPGATLRTADDLLAATTVAISDADGQTLPPKQWPVQRVLRGEQFTGCELCLHDQDSERWVAFSGAPIYDAHGALTLGLLTALDISQHRNDEETLRLHAAAVSRTNAELAMALRLKDEFLAMMSHELRTPLNAVLGSSEALAEGLYGPLAERQLRALATIERSGRLLLAILSDILDLSRIEAGAERLEVGPLVVDELCQSALRMVQPSAERKAIQLRCSNEGRVERLRADERRLTQILVNLLDNAIKFTRDGGTVGVEVTADAALEQIQLCVWDTGIGIATDDLARLFKPFTQLDGRLARQYGGIGLGLTLVRRLVDLHGGSISLDSEPGQGSRFTVRLPWGPAAGPEAARAIAMADSPQWARPPHVLRGNCTQMVLRMVLTPPKWAKKTRNLLRDSAS
jgi:signal transduction histidine kinase